ncbi:hypothetical protein CHARACLAT_025604, partial [Characodon lateralis]|nr:hypothetical protein [Characodon lateralis]
MSVTRSAGCWRLGSRWGVVVWAGVAPFRTVPALVLDGAGAVCLSPSWKKGDHLLGPGAGCPPGVSLYNGPNEQAPLIGAFCGNTPPAASSTTSSALTLVFRTDSSISMSGFQMMWYQNGCGGNVGGPSGSISSPGYPNRYPENTECIWYVTSTPGSSVTLNIHEFDVEFHENCNYDVLEVYGGPDLQAPRLARLCSTTSSPMQVSSTGNLLTVRFKSDAYVSGRGFNANWAEVQG